MTASGKFVRVGAIVGITAMLFAPAVAASADAGDPGTVSGRVTDAGTGVGVAGFEVNLRDASGTSIGFANTGPVGNYSIDIPASVTPGDHTLDFGTNLSGAYFGEYWDDKPDFASADFFSLNASSALVNYDAALTRGATISGKVTGDAHPDGLEGVFVGLYEVPGSALKGSDTTGPDGTYHIDGVPAGNYAVRFLPCDSPCAAPWYVEEWWDDEESFEAADTLVAVVGTDYPGTDANLARNLPDVDRLSGPNRFATAATIAQEFTDTGGVVYLANGLNFPDALSAAPAAAHRDAPLLLTGRNSIPAVVKTELERLLPSEIVVVGGEGVVSAAVFDALGAYAPLVVRHSGQDRYATSRVVSAEAFDDVSLSSVYVATGANYPDALSAAAAAGSKHVPVILVNGSAGMVDAATTELLEDLLAAAANTEVFVAGGTGAVSAGVETSIDGLTFVDEVTRLGGANRYLTSVAINGEAFLGAADVYLATGAGYADALAGAPLAGGSDSPLFVTPGHCVNDYLVDEIDALGASRVVLLGGTGALGVAVETLTEC